MNIAMFSDSYTPYVSGVVRSVQHFSRGLTALGHKVYIFAPAYTKDLTDSRDQEEITVYRFYSVPAPTCPNFFLPIPISVRADRLVRRLKIDIIHTHSPFLMGQLGVILSRKRNIPLIFTHHTLYHEYTHYVPAPSGITRQMIINYVHRYFRHCDHIITPTLLIKELLLELYQLDKAITPIPTGIDLAAYEQADKTWLRLRFNIPAQDRILLFIGRLSKEKNPLIVLETYALLAKKLGDHLHVVFVGDGPEKKRLREWAAKHGLAHLVHFTGSIDSQQVADCCQGADLFLFGSTTETQGLVLGEAMAAGLPVVAVAATGTNDIVIHGKNGYVCPSDPQTLAEYCEKILTNRSLHSALATNALATAKELSIENTSMQMLRVYHQVLASKINIT